MNPRLAPVMAGAATAALVLALRLYRPWQLRWGSTDEEVQRALPGDEVVPDPTFAATRAITVNAPPERVWPWIAQMGFGRAGWYSYDLLDNFGRRSSERVIASLQEVQVGDTVPMGPGGGRSARQRSGARPMVAVVGRSWPFHLGLASGVRRSRTHQAADQSSHPLSMDPPDHPVQPPPRRALGLSDDAEMHDRHQGTC